MSILAVVATFTDDPGRAADARRMLEALPGWAPDGLAVEEAAGAALGFGKLVVSRQQGHAAQPLRDREAGLVLVADVRIDNRDELGPRFGLPASATDAEIVLAGYRRLGPALVPLLVGDFAFVVWDERQRRLFAARDTFGARPLVYRVLGDRVLVASDVEQILAVDPTARVVDDVSVVDWLLSRRRFEDRTFFEPLKQLGPGAALVATAGGAVRLSRWWSPTAPSAPITDEREGLEAFRRVFARAVSDRLIGGDPALAHLSGGFDSSVIALVAGQVGSAARLRAVGSVQPGLPCDESVNMQATAARLPYPFEPWNGNTPVFTDFEAPALAGPCQRVPRSNGTIGDLAIARREGARVILSGLGGDALHPIGDHVRDFIDQRRWDLVLRSTVQVEGASWSWRLARVREAAKLMVPVGVRRHIRRLRHRPQLPSWLAGKFRDQALSAPPEPEDHSALLGKGGSARLNEWRRPLSFEIVRMEQRAAAEACVEFRCPFLDLRVAALADRLPLSLWRPPLYRHRLHAIAYRDLLPPELQRPRNKTVFGTAVINRLAHSRGPIERLLGQPSARVGRYLQVAPLTLVPAARGGPPGDTAAAIGRATDRGSSTWQDADLAMKLAALEAWLRIV
jgi:asparagine synthetase B (glutamine-hydrolysing)